MRALVVWSFALLVATRAQAREPDPTLAVARALVRDAPALVAGEVLDLAGNSKGSLTTDELAKLSAELRRGHPSRGALVVAGPPWNAVLVLRTRAGKRYVTQVVGDQWLRIERPDPLVRQKSGQPPSAAHASEILLEYPSVAWDALERVLGAPQNKEYRGPRMDLPAPKPPEPR